MKDTLSMIIAVIFLVILLVFLPLYNYFERQDDISYNLTLKTVTTFVDEVVANGYLDQTTYDKFVERLSTTGNSYDIQIEAKVKVLTVDPDNTNPDDGEETYVEQYVSYYNKDIFDDETGNISTVVDNSNSLKNDIFFLDEGDKFYVTVVNTNTTMATSLLNIIASGSSKEKINITYGATVKNNNWENTDIAQLYQSDILVKIELQNANDANSATGYPEYSFDSASDRILEYKITILNSDDTDLASKITDNIRLVGDLPNCYISPSSIESDGEGVYTVKFILDESKTSTYFSDYDYNIFQCFLPANVIQGTFSKNASASSSKILMKVDSSVEITEEI